jgi:Flp pilus assembly protein TadG
MMTKLKKIIRDFVSSQRGMAAVEFAMVAPILPVLLLGTIDAGKGVDVYMKVRSATTVLAEISNQYKTIHDSDMQQILGATAVVLAPNTGSPKVVISQLHVTAAGAATVSWSNTLNGVARATGSAVSVPSSFSVGTYVLLSEVSYKFTPFFGLLMQAPVTLKDSLYSVPRSSASITRTSP